MSYGVDSVVAGLMKDQGYDAIELLSCCMMILKNQTNKMCCWTRYFRCKKSIRTVKY